MFVCACNHSGVKLSKMISLFQYVFVNIEIIFKSHNAPNPNPLQKASFLQ